MSTVQSSRPGRGSKPWSSPKRMSSVDVGRAGVTGDEPADLEVVGAHRRAVLAHHPQVAGPVGRLLQAPARPRPQRADGEQHRHPHSCAGPARGAEQQPPAAQARPAGLVVGGEGGHLLLARLERQALLDHLVVGHEVLGSEHDARADAAERQRQQHALRLGLATLPVHDRQGDGRHGGHHEALPLLPARRAAARAPRSPGARSRPPPADRAAGADPRHQGQQRHHAHQPGHEPLGDGSSRPIGTPPGSSGSSRYST